MPDKFVIVSLDLDPGDIHFEKYNALSAKEKIDYLAERIDKLCQQLHQDAPDANWIFAWREYGITDPDSRFISVESKKYLKEVMKSLTAKHKQLTIISGTVATKKHYPKEKISEVLNNVENYYTTNPDILTDDLQQGLSHLQQLKEFNPSAEGINVVRNTCYIFTDDIYRKDKTNPYIETSKLKAWWKAVTDEELLAELLVETIFQPGNKKDNSSLFSIKTIDGTIVKIGIEICREQNQAVLRKELERTGETKPLFHFVVSFGMPPSLDNIAGFNYVSFDPNVKPQLIVDQQLDNNNPSNITVELYQHNALDQLIYLRGPLQPLYPKEKELLVNFNDIADLITSSDFSDKSDKSKALTFIKQAFILALGERKNLAELVSTIKSLSEYKILIAETSPKKDENARLVVEVHQLLEKIAHTHSNLASITKVDIIPKPTTPTFIKKPSLFLDKPRKRPTKSKSGKHRDNLQTSNETSSAEAQTLANKKLTS